MGETWEEIAAKRGTTVARCAVGPCQDARVAGGSYCGKHGPKRGAASSRPQARGSAAIVCPQCQVRGRVRTVKVKIKRRVSGGKATGAVLTGGISLLATGLSRKEQVTKATCGNCSSTWTF